MLSTFVKYSYHLKVLGLTFVAQCPPGASRACQLYKLRPPQWGARSGAQRGVRAPGWVIQSFGGRRATPRPQPVLVAPVHGLFVLLSWEAGNEPGLCRCRTSSHWCSNRRRQNGPQKCVDPAPCVGQTPHRMCPSRPTHRPRQRSPHCQLSSENELRPHSRPHYHP